MTPARVGIGALGVAGLVYGLVLLVGLGPAQVLPVLGWVLGGIVVHDAVLAPAVVLLGLLLARGAPARLRTTLLRVVVVLGPLTLVAVPVLGRFGARPDNQTLLDRPYWVGYLLISVLVVAVAATDLRRRPADQRRELPDS